MRYFNAILTVTLVTLTLNGYGGIDSLKIDSLERVVREGTEREKYNSLLELVFEFVDLDNNKALEYGTRANSAAAQLGDEKEVITSTRILGQILRRLGRSEEATRALKRALRLADSVGHAREQLLTARALGVAHLHAAHYDSALRYSFYALRVSTKQGDVKEIGQALCNIGLIYYKLSEYKQSVKYYERALEVVNSFDETTAMVLLTNISLCYSETGNFSAADQVLDTWMLKYKNNAPPGQVMQWKYAKAHRHLSLEQFKEAKPLYDTARLLCRQIGDRRYEIENDLGIARCLIGLGNIPEAELELQRCEVNARESDYPSILIRVYQNWIPLLRSKGDLERLAVVQQELFEAREKVWSEDSFNRLSVARVEFEEQKNRELIAEQEEVIALNGQVINRQRWLGIVGGLLMISLIVLVVVLRKFVKYQKNISVELDRKVCERTRDLQTSEWALVKALGEQRATMDFVSRQLRASLATFRGLWSVGVPAGIRYHDVSEKFEDAAIELSKVASVVDRFATTDNAKAGGEANNDASIPASLEYHGNGIAAKA